MMQKIQFTGNNIEITEALRDFINTKFQRLEKYKEHITSMHVILNVDKNVHFAEAKIHLPHTEIYASAESDNMYKTIDLLQDKLSRQLLKHKGKMER